MIRPSALLAVLGLTCLPLLGAGAAQAQTLTWVSGLGDDANPCSRAAPCKTFQGAVTKTAAGGEVDCLDSGSFGSTTSIPLVITKSITINCTDAIGTVLANSASPTLPTIGIGGTGIVVNLRGLLVQGGGFGNFGIVFNTGAALTLEGVTVMNFTAGPATGLLFQPSTTNAILTVKNSSFVNNSNGGSSAGILVQPGSGGSALAVINNSSIERNSSGIIANSTSGPIKMTVRDSIVSGNALGILAMPGNPNNVMVDRVAVSNNPAIGIAAVGASSTVRINQSVITGNGTGLSSISGGVLHSFKNNAINDNGTDGTPVPQDALN
jgi:hypothetical protein